MPLYSATSNHPWPRNKPLHFHCPWPALGHKIPHEDCLCGIYAVRPDRLDPLNAYIEEAFSANPRSITILGEVLLWGHITEHAQGWRAQQAYPKTLYVPSTLTDAHKIAQQLADVYSVPAQVLDAQQMSRLMGSDHIMFNGLVQAWASALAAHAKQAPQRHPDHTMDWLNIMNLSGHTDGSWHISASNHVTDCPIKLVRDGDDLVVSCAVLSLGPTRVTASQLRNREVSALYDRLRSLAKIEMATKDN